MKKLTLLFSLLMTNTIDKLSPVINPEIPTYEAVSSLNNVVPYIQLAMDRVKQCAANGIVLPHTEEIISPSQNDPYVKFLIITPDLTITLRFKDRVDYYPSTDSAPYTYRAKINLEYSTSKPVYILKYHSHEKLYANAKCHYWLMGGQIVWIPVCVPSNINPEQVTSNHLDNKTLNPPSTFIINDFKAYSSIGQNILNNELSFDPQDDSVYKKPPVVNAFFLNNTGTAEKYKARYNSYAEVPNSIIYNAENLNNIYKKYTIKWMPAANRILYRTSSTDPYVNSRLSFHKANYDTFYSRQLVGTVTTFPLAVWMPVGYIRPTHGEQYIAWNYIKNENYTDHFHCWNPVYIDDYVNYLNGRGSL